MAQAEASGAFKGEPGKDGVVSVTGAAVGQTVKITAVDENGNPTEWEATDFPESSTQTDWNQNDESAHDYVKNRPFYEADELVVISECEVTSITTNQGWMNLTDGNGNYAYPTNCDLPLATYVYGDDYVIDINGETYNLKLSQSYDGSYGGVYYLGFNVAGGNNGHANLASGAKFAIFTQLGRADDFVDGETFEASLSCYLSSDIALPATIKIKHSEKVLKQLDPKYIKDMYYDNGVTITEVVPETTVDDFTVMQDPIYGIQNAISMTPVVGATYVVNWDGTEYTTTCNSIIDTTFMYIGNENYVNMQPEGDIPFAIIFADGNVFLATESTASSHTISVTEYNHDLKQIDTKYLPILEKVEETIIKTYVTDFIELRGPEYRKLLGKYNVVIDGVSETVEFIDDGIVSFVETDSFAIESWTDPEGNVDNNGFTMEFANQDGNSHSVEIIAIKDVIKEEYLPDVGYATEEYVDECVAAVREEIDFIQVNYISDLPNVIGNYSMMLVRSGTSLDDVQWNGTLLIMRRFMAYGIWDFTAIDSVGAFYNGSVNLRNNTVSLYFVDSLANKADKKSIDKDYIALTDIENGYEYIIHMKNGNLISVCKIVSIEVTTMPTQTEYIDGEPFNPAGIVITATCQDGTTRIIDSNTITYNSVVTLDNCSAFEIQYVDAGIKYTTTIVLTCIDAGSSLSDFKYTIEEEGTYTLTGWKDTKNGVFSTECIIPDSNKINL